MFYKKFSDHNWELETLNIGSGPRSSFINVDLIVIPASNHIAG